jgi:hypothetical protein
LLTTGLECRSRSDPNEIVDSTSAFAIATADKFALEYIENRFDPFDWFDELTIGKLRTGRLTIKVELGREKTVAKIISRLETAKGDGRIRQAHRRGAVKVEGTWGSFAPLLAAYISKELGRPILYIRPHIDDADKAADDLHTFGAEQVEALPAWEGEEELADATDEIRAERLKLVSRLSSLVARDRKDKARFIIPASIQALCQPIPKPQALEESCLRLQIDKTMPLEQTAEWLVENGFERVERVDLPGQFAHRGGIIDIYAPLVSEKSFLDEPAAECPSEAAETIRI